MGILFVVHILNGTQVWQLGSKEANFTLEGHEKVSEVRRYLHNPYASVNGPQYPLVHKLNNQVQSLYIIIHAYMFRMLQFYFYLGSKRIRLFPRWR